MSARTSAALAGLVCLLACCCAACDAPRAGADRFADEGWIVTQVPAVHPPAGTHSPADVLDLDVRYPAGSRIVFAPAGFEDGATGDDVPTPRVLSGDLAAAGDPSLTLDGTAVLFTGRASASSGWALYRSRLDSPAPRLVSSRREECAGPRELAHGRLVATCRTPETNGRWALFTFDRDGSDPHRITFGPGAAIDPLPLADGRILFSMGQRPGAGRADADAFALFVLNPDGTSLESFTGSHRPPPIKRRPRATDDDGIVYLVSDTPGAGRVERVEMRLPHGAPTAAWQAAADTTDPFAATAVEPVRGGAFLVAAAWHEPTAAVYLVSPDGRATMVFDDRAYDETEAIPNRPAPAPRGRPSGRQDGRSTATLIGYDAAHGDGTIGPGQGVPAPASVSVEALRTDLPGEPLEVLEPGEAPVMNDGSFHVEVPTDLPIRIRSLDAGGVELARSDWFWMRPGEVRACFGCHEDRASAPPNRRVRALEDPPTELYATGARRSQ